MPRRYRSLVLLFFLLASCSSVPPTGKPTSPDTGRSALDKLHSQIDTIRKVVIATGYYDVPNMLDCPGEELGKVLHYYKEPHPYYDHDVAVVGAKNSATIDVGSTIGSRCHDRVANRQRPHDRGLTPIVVPGVVTESLCGDDLGYGGGCFRSLAL